MNLFKDFMCAIRGIDPYPYVPDEKPAPDHKDGMLVSDGMGTFPNELRQLVGLGSKGMTTPSRLLAEVMIEEQRRAHREAVMERIREEIRQKHRGAIAEEKSSRKRRLFKDHRKFKGRWEQ